MDLDEYSKLKRKADELRAEADRAAGALEQLMGKLREDYGCDTLEEAEAKLERLREEEAEAEDKYEKELASFKAKWGDKLEGKQDADAVASMMEENRRMTRPASRRLKKKMQELEEDE